MALPDLTGLPPWALVIFVVSLAIIFAVGWFGKQQGSRTGNGSEGSRSVELAMATFDPTALKQVAAAVEALNINTVEQNRILREQGRDVTKELAELRGELRRQGENLRK